MESLGGYFRFLLSMGLANHRHHSARVLARRSKHWNAITFRWLKADGSPWPAPVCHFLKTTARPCSCAICKRPRYKREPEDWASKDL